MSQIKSSQLLHKSTIKEGQGQKRSSIFSSLFKSLTRSRTPQVQQDPTYKPSQQQRNFSISSTESHKQQQKEVLGTAKVQVRQKPVQNNSLQIIKTKPNKNHHEFHSQVPRNALIQNGNAVIAQPRQNTPFEPYSQSSAVIDFLKSEQTEQNGASQNKENQVYPPAAYDEDSIMSKNKTAILSMMSKSYIQSDGHTIEQHQKAKQLQSMPSNVIDISSWDMLQDHSMQLDFSQSIRDPNRDNSVIKPVLKLETLQSKESSDDEDNDISFNNSKISKISQQNINRQYLSSRIEQIKEKEQPNSATQGQNTVNGKERSASQNSNENIQQQQAEAKKLDTTMEIQIRQINYESDAISSDNSNRFNKCSSNESQENQQQQSNLQKESTKSHILSSNPFYFSKQRLRDSTTTTDQGNGFVFNKIIIEDCSSNQEEEFTLKNKSLIKGVDNTYQIKVVLNNNESSGGSQQQSVNISIQNFKQLCIESSIYNEKSSYIPTFKFSELILPLVKNEPSCLSNGKSCTFENIIQLKEGNEQKFEFLRFKNFEDCSWLFQDILLTDLVFDQIKIPSVNRKSIFLYQQQNNDICLLREVVDFFTIADLIYMSNLAQLGNQKLKEDQILTFFLEILRVYNVFVKEQVALPNLSPETIIVSYDSLAISFNNLQDCYPLENKNASLQNEVRNKERDVIIKMFKNLQRTYQADSPTLKQSQNTSQQELTTKGEDNQTTFYESFYTSLKNGDIQEAISSTETLLAKLSEYNTDQDSIENITMNSSAISLSNAASIVLSKRGSSSFNQKNEIQNQKLANDYKKKRQHLSKFIEVFEAQVVSKKKRQESSNFFKCQKLTYLHQIYSNIFLKRESIKTLEELKNLKAECYGIDSEEFLKTLQILCKSYFDQKQYKPLLLYIEAYTEYLRNTISIQNANELFEICKFKLKMTKSPTIQDDIQTLITFLQEKQKKNSSSFSPTPNPESKCIFSLSTLLYQLACSYKYIEDNNSAMDYFKQSLTQIKIEQDVEEKAKSKLEFYSLSNIARIHFRNKKFKDAKTILKGLKENADRFQYPMYYQYLGQIEFEDKNYKQAQEYLQQCYLLRENDQKCNRDYLELLLYLVLVNFKQFGSSSLEFQRLCLEMKNFTGDYYNLDCLLIIGNLLYDQKLYDLALKKLDQAQGITNLLLLSEKSNESLYKNYKKKVGELEKKLSKIRALSKQNSIK